MKNIKPEKRDKLAIFDVMGKATRLYPISGGLAQSSGITKNFADAEYDVVSGPKLINKALQEFLNRKELKILDILNCDGGCISGPGMISQDNIEIRRQKVINYWKAAGY